MVNLKNRKTKLLFLMTVLLFSLIETADAKNNIHLIESSSDSGYAIYRTSKPKKKKDMRQFCDLGIQEMMVLSGNADEYEFKYQEACPGLKVIYNIEQSAKIPLTKTFLQFFDNWVEESKKSGKKIAFRCNCGCHRTGRLAAYYQMKYQKLAVSDAKTIMGKHGKYMMFYNKKLRPQVDALKDYLEDRPCSVEEKWCVQ